jgi:hypothetical protein
VGTAAAVPPPDVDVAAVRDDATLDTTLLERDRTK